MMIFSLGIHIALFITGSAVSQFFPTIKRHDVVVVELADWPVSALPEEAPAPPPTVKSEPGGAAAKAVRHTPPRPHAVARQAGRWLEKLDARIPRAPESPVRRGAGRVGGLPVRQWANAGPVRPADFAPAVAPARTDGLGRHVEELEARVRRSGVQVAGPGIESEASLMFGNTGDAAGEPVPEWVREMIRRRVQQYLPELEAIYSDAIRKNPDLRGKLLVRFRIDPSGKVERAEPAAEPLGDSAFVDAVLRKVRRWTFAPTGGRAVDVIYPFVFVVPS